MRRLSRRGVKLGVVLLVACHKTNDAPADASLDAPAPAEPHAAPSAAEPSERPPPGEAARASVARVDAEPLLAPHATAIRARFGDAALAMQKTTLAGGRIGLLLETPDEKTSMVLVTDGATLAWSKERPTAGMTPPARELAIVPHPQGGAVLFAYDEPAQRVAMRIWSADGAPFADLEVMETAVCGALDAAYWPGHGWIAVAATMTGPRAALVREDGAAAWRDGIEVGVPARNLGPVTIVIDTPHSFVLVQRVAGKTGDRAVATRYDPLGHMTWDKPVELGDARPGSKNRIGAATARAGVVKIDLVRPIEIDQGGMIVVLKPPP
jgi:hypothetical protein